MGFEFAYTPDCLICGNGMERVVPSDLLADRCQRDIYRVQAERLQYRAEAVWYCAHCNVIHPFEFVGRQEAHRPIVDGADEANCPSCGYDVVRLGGCERFNAFQKIYYCQFCIARARAIAIFGYTKPEGSDHFYFTRLDPDDVLARLDCVENENQLFTVRPGSIGPGQVHTALTEYRDMFRKDPEHAFHAMRQPHLRTIRFIFTYAFNHNPGCPDEARRERAREALENHSYENIACPCPDRFRRVELGPARTVLACKSDHSHVRVCVAAALSALVGSMALGEPEVIGIGALLAVWMLAYVGFRVTAYTQLVVEEGRIRVEQKGLVPFGASAELIRITAICLGTYCKALGARRVVPIAQEIIDSEGAGTETIPQGLLFMNEDQTTFAAVKGDYRMLIWMRRVILEAAKAQGICKTGAPNGETD